MKYKVIYENIFDQSILTISKKEIVLDIGGYSPLKGIDPRKCDLTPYRSEFRTARYYCLDILTKGNPHIVGDANKLPIKSETIDGIICYAVLEHIIDPQKVVNDMHRVLKKGGEAFLYVPFLYPYHSTSLFKDYHRFTIDIILYMFKDYDEILIQPGENFAKTSLRFVTAFSYRNYFKFLEKPLELLFKRFARHDRTKNTTGFHIYARK